jgi:hypothetical protein
MSYFPDLTPHTYNKSIGTLSGVEPEFLNIGWLDKDNSYKKGKVDESFLCRVKELAQVPYAYHYGFHFCDLPPCDGTQTHGTGSIIVCSSEGKWYAAPVLLHHYIECHSYLPPEEFVRAILSPKHDNLSLLGNEDWECIEKVTHIAKKNGKSDAEIDQMLVEYVSKTRNRN